MKDPNNPCLFCDIKKSGCAHENELAYASYDSYPVTEHHCLIIPKRHIKDYFDLSNDELVACNELIQIINCAKYAKSLGIEVHAGHGIDYKTAKILSRIKEIKEFNIGHFIIGESIFFGLKKVINNFKKILR